MPDFCPPNVWPQYEAWTLNKSFSSNVEAFGMQYHQKLMKIRYVADVMNEEVFKSVDLKAPLLLE